MNATSKEVGKLRKAKQDATELQQSVKAMKLERQRLDELAVTLNAEVTKLISGIGNIVHESVVVSETEDDNAIVGTYGGQPPLIDNGKGHHDILYMIGGYEPEKGRNIAGHRGYFLTGVAVMLNQALISYGTTFLVKHNYTPVQPPFFMRKEVMSLTAQLDDFDEQLYKVSGSSTLDDSKDSNKDDGKNLYLIATSEQPISAMHRTETLAREDMPIRYAGVSSCFRKEAGKSGADIRGIFRVHQFDKIEQFVLCAPEESWAMHETMRNMAEQFLESLGLPYQVVNIVSNELNSAAAKKYDIECWFPDQKAFRELVSCSNCTDYQSRAMETKMLCTQEDRKAEYVHMLNSTLCATGRAICCILENYQTPTGVVVPEVLRPFMGGLEFMPFIRDPLPDAELVATKKAKKAKKNKSGNKKK
jgi:seryl-tRNA synthetase